EMFGIVLLEAMASGLPCIVHEHPVVEWVVGTGGIAINMREAGALASGLRRLLEGDSQRSFIGQRARERCTRVFAREQVLNNIMEYYRCVTDQCKNSDQGGKSNEA